MGQSNPPLPMVERVWHLADLLDRMIAHVGVSGAAGRLEGGEGLRRAAENCLRCEATVMCERFLAEADRDADIPLFCPNRELLSLCRQLTPSSARSTAEIARRAE